VVSIGITHDEALTSLSMEVRDAPVLVRVPRLNEKGIPKLLRGTPL